MALWVMRTVGIANGRLAGRLYLPDLRITLFHAREYRIEVIDFDAEMVDAPGYPGGLRRKAKPIFPSLTMIVLS